MIGLSGLSSINIVILFSFNIIILIVRLLLMVVIAQAYIRHEDGKENFVGSATECALLKWVESESYWD